MKEEEEVVVVKEEEEEVVVVVKEEVVVDVETAEKVEVPADANSSTTHLCKHQPAPAWPLHLRSPL